MSGSRRLLVVLPDELERVPFEEDPGLWQIQGAVDSITGYRMIGSSFLVPTRLHPDTPDTEWVAQGPCGVVSSSLYRTDISRVEVEASNGNRIVRCDVSSSHPMRAAR